MSQITDALSSEPPDESAPRQGGDSPPAAALPAQRGNMRRAVLGGVLSFAPGAMMLAFLEVGTGLSLTIVPMILWAWLTAFLIREFGRGTDRRFGILAVGFVLLECLAIDVAAAEGIFLAQTGQSAEHSFSLQTALALAPRFWHIPHLAAYGLAAWMGYRLSFYHASGSALAPVRRDPMVGGVVLMFLVVPIVIPLLCFLNLKRQSIVDLDLSPQGRMRVWAPNRELMAVVIKEEKQPYRVELYQAGRAKAVLSTLRDPPYLGTVWCLSFSPDSRILALGCRNRDVWLWDTRLGGQEALVQTDAVNSLVFSPSGDRLAAGLSDGTIAVWDVRTRRLQRSWSAHSSAIRSLVVAPDGQTLFSAGACDGVVKSWDSATGQTRNSWPMSMDWITSLALSPDGRTLAIGGGSFDRPGEAVLVNLPSGESRQLFTVPVNTVANVAFTRDGRNLVAATMAPVRLVDWPCGGQTHRWDLETGEELP